MDQPIDIDERCLGGKTITDGIWWEETVFLCEYNHLRDTCMPPHFASLTVLVISGTQPLVRSHLSDGFARHSSH